MSKSRLRKELSLLTKEQLIDLTLDAYAARREVKEFYDFFLKPDAQALQDKFGITPRQLPDLQRHCSLT